MKTKRIIILTPLILILLAVANILLVGLRKRPSYNQLIISSIGDASYLNPVLAQDSASSEVNGFIFNGLLKYDKDLHLTGDLASSWEVIDKETRPKIIFHLRRGIKWHDGVPFTARDVRFTYETIMDPHTNTVRRSDYELVESIETPDPYTVVVTYKQPYSPGLSSWTIGIVPEHILKGKDINTDVFNRNPIGTGPFKFVEWVSDEKILLKANSDYFEGRPGLDRIIYRIIPESSMTEIELLTGGVDMAGIFPHQYNRMRKVPFLKVYRYPSLGYTYIGFNLKNDLFKDRRVRQALSYAINRKEILEYILFGLGQEATGPFPPGLWYSNPHAKRYDYSPQKAKALLKEAGFEDHDGDGWLDKDGKIFQFKLITNSGNNVRKDIGVLVQRYWSNIGIKVKLELYEWSVFLKNFINARHFDACILGWGLGVDPDPYSIWHSSQIKDGFNFISYSNPEVDRLLELGRRIYDQEERRKIYWKIHEILAEDQPYAFLYVADSTPGLNKRIKVRRKGGDPPFTEVKAGKAGIMYNIIDWYVPGGIMLKD